MLGDSHEGRREGVQVMSAFQSLALALRGHFHKSFAQLPPDIQQRVQVDFAPWPWDSKTSRERCHRAKRWDYENDPARCEIREGIEALTNPDSPAYSPEETRRLRGDFLPEPRNVQPTVVQPTLEWDAPQPPSKQRASTTVKESAEARGVRLLKAFEAEVKASGRYGSLARVHARELAINPKADRSNISKQIQKARVARTESKQGAAVFGSFVRGGKTVS